MQLCKKPRLQEAELVSNFLAASSSRALGVGVSADELVAAFNAAVNAAAAAASEEPRTAIALMDVENAAPGPQQASNAEDSELFAFAMDQETVATAPPDTSDAASVNDIQATAPDAAPDTSDAENKALEPKETAATVPEDVPDTFDAASVVQDTAAEDAPDTFDAENTALEPTQAACVETASVEHGVVDAPIGAGVDAGELAGPADAQDEPAPVRAEAILARASGVEAAAAGRLAGCNDQAQDLQMQPATAAHASTQTPIVYLKMRDPIYVHEHGPSVNFVREIVINPVPFHPGGAEEPAEVPAIAREF